MAVERRVLAARNTVLVVNVSLWYPIAESLGISLAVGRLTLDQLGQVRILDPQPSSAIFYAFSSTVSLYQLEHPVISCIVDGRRAYV